jgi:hypothetical protein
VEQAVADGVPYTGEASDNESSWAEVSNESGLDAADENSPDTPSAAALKA